MIKKIIFVSFLSIALAWIFSSDLVAQNQQDYSMNKTLCAHYIKVSREQVDKDNLQLAKVYAQKAIQANPWEKAAWANYNDIIQKLADNGDIEDFDTFIEESSEKEAPSEADAGSQFEGC